MTLHRCALTIDERYRTPYNDHRFGYGDAIDVCQEYDDGTLWIANGEYGAPVAFCPFCGHEAKVNPYLPASADDTP